MGWFKKTPQALWQEKMWEADVEQKQGNLGKAEDAYKEAKKHAASCLPEPDRMADTTERLADLYRGRTMWDLAIREYKEILGLRETRIHSAWETWIATLGQLASVYADAGETDLAEDCWRKLLSKMREVYGIDDGRTAPVLLNLGNVLFRKGDFAGAKESYVGAEKIAVKLFGPNAAQLRDFLECQRVLCLRTGCDKEAAAIRERMNRLGSATNNK
jgi:tetratricopeptide (TPR) repeat protein